jgi:hypothetical protein
MSHEKHSDVISVLWECATMCEHCASACLQEDDVKMLAKCIRLDLDCAEICKTTATLLSRNAEHNPGLMQACIQICKACAEECEKHSHMEHCRECAEICRRCEEVCSGLN